MAHLRATVSSKGGNVSRLGNKKDGMSVTIDGPDWRLSIIVCNSEQPAGDYVFIAKVNKFDGRIIGEVTRLDFLQEVVQ